MKRFTSIAEALQFAAQCETDARFAEAAVLYRRLLEAGVSGEVDGRPTVVVVHEALIRNAMHAGRLDDALEWFERLLPLLKRAADPDFDLIYCRGLELTRSHPLPLARLLRFSELAVLLRSTRGIEGALAECGCFKGLSSYVLASHLRLENPRFAGQGFHLFDSFAGLGAPGTEDELPPADRSAEAERLRAMTHPGSFAAPLAEVRAALAEFPHIEFHAGWIPQSFAGQPERRYRFVHVDVDLYAPTLACLQYFLPRLQPGALLVSDDFSWPGARRALEAFSRDQRVPLEVNRHGQAVLRKPC